MEEGHPFVVRLSNQTNGGEGHSGPSTRRRAGLRDSRLRGNDGWECGNDGWGDGGPFENLRTGQRRTEMALLVELRR